MPNAKWSMPAASSVDKQKCPQTWVFQLHWKCWRRWSMARAVAGEGYLAGHAPVLGIHFVWKEKTHTGQYFLALLWDKGCRWRGSAQCSFCSLCWTTSLDSGRPVSRAIHPDSVRGPAVSVYSVCCILWSQAQVDGGRGIFYVGKRGGRRCKVHKMAFAQAVRKGGGPQAWRLLRRTCFLMISKHAFCSFAAWAGLLCTDATAVTAHLEGLWDPP